MNDTIDMLLEAADSLVGNTEEETINGYTLDEAVAILEAADEILNVMNEGAATDKKKEIMKELKNYAPKEESKKFFAGKMTKEEGKRFYVSFQTKKAKLKKEIDDMPSETTGEQLKGMFDTHSITDIVLAGASAGAGTWLILDKQPWLGFIGLLLGFVYFPTDVTIHSDKKVKEATYDLKEPKTAMVNGREHKVLTEVNYSRREVEKFLDKISDTVEKAYNKYYR